MKKKSVVGLFCGMCTFALISSAQAVPMDLSTFSVLESEVGSVTESGGMVSFAENYSDAALYFYDDFFYVDPLATTLSFDYDFTLGQFDMDDYLQFNVNYTEEWYVDTSGTGHVEFDLTSYQGTTISIDWGLIWGGDWDATTTGSIFNIDVATAPVPEPATMLLFGTGTAGLIVAKRKKRAGHFK